MAARAPGTTGVVRSPRRARIAIGAAGGLLGALIACSSDTSPNPPELGRCTEKNGIPCGSGTIGGGSSPTPEAGTDTDGDLVTVGGDGSTCSGAGQIFGSSTASCITCIETSCCENQMSCPNDQSCAAIAVCVLGCLPTDPACVQTCEGQASLPTIMAFTDLASCATGTCPQCPTLQTASGGDL